MNQYPEMNEPMTLSTVREAQASYGVQTAVTMSKPERMLPLRQSNSSHARDLNLEERTTASVNSEKVAAFYYSSLKEIEAKCVEWQRIEQERWERLEMEMGIEKEIAFKEPELPVRLIKARVQNCGPAPVPDFLFDDLDYLLEE